MHDQFRGVLANPFQTFHVQLFGWLPALFGDEIAQILVGRTAMAGLVAANAMLLFGIGRRFLSRAGALFGVLGYLSFGYVIGHAASFRVDPLLTTLLLTSIWLVLRWPAQVAAAAAAGVAAAVATLLSVKAAFHLVAIGGVYLCYLFAAERRGPVLAAGAAYGVAYLLALLGLFALHRLSLGAAPSAEVGSFLGRSAAKVLSGDDLVRVLLYLAVDYLHSLPAWALLLGGLVAARRAATAARGRERAARLIPLALALPILTLVFYRNAFPYYYALALAPGAAILVGLAYDRLLARIASFPDWQRNAIAGLLAAALVALLTIGYARQAPDRLFQQQAVIDTVHGAFPEPVPYLDGYGMVASFPWTGFFMSTWGRDVYHAVGQPVLAERAEALAPVFVVANSIPLAAALLGDDRPGIDEQRLLAEDERFLRDNYLRYWGPIFVAGKRLPLAAGTATEFFIHVPGVYRIAADTRLRLDGRAVAPGSEIELARGSHRLEASAGGASEALLRWASVPEPTSPALDMCLFAEFVSPTNCALPVSAGRGPRPAWGEPTP